MAQCSNCKKNLSCGCQKRKASDGVSVCSNCSVAYEAKIKVLKQATATTTPTTIQPKWGANRYKTK
jgi:hypothetical protein